MTQAEFPPVQECSQVDVFDATAALTSPELLKHQVEFVFLLEELHQFQDVTAERVKGELWEPKCAVLRNPPTV